MVVKIIIIKSLMMKMTILFVYYNFFYHDNDYHNDEDIGEDDTHCEKTEHSLKEYVAGKFPAARLEDKRSIPTLDQRLEKISTWKGSEKEKEEDTGQVPNYVHPNTHISGHSESQLNIVQDW